jgi:biotin operon repressor
MDDLKKILGKRGGIERYKGFPTPNTTPTPDDLFDLFLPDLNLGEIRVILYIIRRTLGFKKKVDQISLKQLCGGISKLNGEELDRGTGMSRGSVITALKSLQKKGLINVTKQRTIDGDNAINAYSLRFREGVV